MLLTSRKEILAAENAPASPTTPPSQGLEYLWRYLADCAQPAILDCGPVRRKTVETLLQRKARIYVADLISPLRDGQEDLWDRTRKVPAFRPEHLLAQLPAIRPGSVNAIFCWQLFDLLPHDALAAVVLQLHGYLKPSGAIFFLLREPRLAAGVEPGWWLESLSSLGREGEGRRPYPYPALTNREVERLIPTGSVKTFLTRAGLREVIVTK